MEQHIGAYLHVINRNQLSDGTQVLHVTELPPPYSLIDGEQQEHHHQSIDNDWKDEIIEIKPMQDNLNRYGFTISGGIDSEYGRAIVITQIDHCSKSSLDNGRTKLRFFDRILSINNINLTYATHDKAVQAFSSAHGKPLSLHIRRLNPVHIEYIDVVLPTDVLNQSLGINIIGGLDENDEDSGLFLTYIDPNGLLGSTIKRNQLRVGDRLLEIKTNYTSANLQWVTHAMGVKLIQRICQDHKRVTLIVAHRNLA
ncbi:unnamed protein product [Rotaria socialis]|uniref:PDZ domain-containing protein n=1 Tax=Rotaria socialis TaxID=392032 RepID=A0A820L305_9BILA|nr:unnamed protein product [Rotaria socialis]CAF3212614.1 unnamed protein product [Rotaria socialis]CAF3379772.1 unnamed protein product [Rotaria socialis]CAF3514036.1 unnamed protein product [Rotaria socialis]CAF4331184.1 unnamed protein product [Rotaria socialis]